MQKNVLVKNTTDLHETIYNYGVIENYESGLNPLALDRVFFKYNKEQDLFIQNRRSQMYGTLCKFCNGIRT